MLIYILLTEALRAETAKERQRERGGRVCRSPGMVGRAGWLGLANGMLAVVASGHYFVRVLSYGWVKGA